MSKRILIVGCGQLGSRHLQAIASLKEIGEIHVIDPNSASLMLGQQRVQEISDLNKDIKFFWHKEFVRKAANGDLCIVATQAKERVKVVNNIVNYLGYRQLLVEKVVSQSIREYEQLLDLSKSKDVRIYVHCQTRGFEVFQYIKNKLDPGNPIVLTEVAGNHGLACNGIHFADLFVYLTGTKKIISRGSRIDQVLHSSKRGKDVFDLSGTLFGSADNGSDFILSYSDKHCHPDVVTITSSQHSFIVDCINQMVFESDRGKQWEPISNKGSYMVSQTTKRHVSDILLRKESILPTLEECYPAHEYILSELLGTFNALLKTKNDYCPVT